MLHGAPRRSSKSGAIATLLWIAACNNGGSRSPDAPRGGGRSDAGVARGEDGGASHAGEDSGSSRTGKIGAACTSDDDCNGATCAMTLARLGALSDPAPGGYCTSMCTAQIDCAQGSVCTGAVAGVSGHCSATCGGTADCRDGYRCVAAARPTTVTDAGTEGTVSMGSCQPIPVADQLADGVVGSACAMDRDCGSGRCVLAEPITHTTYPDGYCSGRCTEDADCGTRGLCTPGFLGAIGSCALRCDGDAECTRDGYRCRAPGGVGRCAPGPKPLPDGAIGSACTSDDDCGGGPMTCAATLGANAAPGGYCTQHCAIDGDCGAGGICVSGVDIVTLLAGICVKSCTLANGCRDGYTCLSPGGQGADEHGVCLPNPPAVDAGTVDAGLF